MITWNHSGLPMRWVLVAVSVGLLGVVCAVAAAAGENDPTRPSASPQTGPQKGEEPATAKKTSNKQTSSKNDVKKNTPSGKKTSKTPVEKKTAKPKEGGKAHKRADPSNVLQSGLKSFLRRFRGMSSRSRFPKKPDMQPRNVREPIFGRPLPLGEVPRAVQREDVKTASAELGDYIDRRAPHNADLAKALRKATARVRDRNWSGGMELLQRLLDLPRDALVRLPSGKLVSLRAEANRLLGELPQDLLETYRLRHGSTAKHLLQAAHEDGDPALFAEVAHRFFHTEAGQRAANHMGSLHFDRGDFGLAARWFRQLLESGSPITSDSKWRFKAALALYLSGSRGVAADLLQDLPPALPRQELAGSPVEPEQWLAEFSELGTPGMRELDDWPMLFGNASHTGTALGSDPLLLPRWSQPLTDSHSIRDSVDRFTQDLVDQGRALIPAWFPLCVDGKVIFRTLRGVRVVDAQTGKALWETREGISAERMLAVNSPRIFRGQGGQVQWRWQIQGGGYYGQSTGHPQLADLLFRNGTYGILSSDGRQLFVIEDHAIFPRQMNYGSRFDPDRIDRYRRKWSSNKLVSYDLNTGRPLWEVGGVRMNESFDLPLAGCYFFGAPTPDGGELFVVGEKQHEIRLMALDANTGRPKWDQLIALSDAKIKRDFGRRWWTSQVAVGRGVLVCPTTVGWLVAVDRLDHSVLWAERYSKPIPPSAQQRQPNQMMVQPGEINSRWCPSAPVVAGRYVVYTPAEFVHKSGSADSLLQEPVLECRSLLDGTRLWQKPKENFLYLAGVFDGRVVLVGTGSVTAFSLDTGKTLWSRPIPPADGKPSGRGVAVGDRFHLPLQSGQLWSIGLEDGRILEKSSVPPDVPPLGNLAMYRGMLLSLGASGLTAFEQRGPLEEEIRRRKRDNPHDVWSLLREADMRLLKQQCAEALASLRQIRPEDVGENSRAKYRTAMIESLQAVVRSNFQACDRELEELAAFVQTGDERLVYRRLLAERLVARKEYRQAFELYWQLSDETPGGNTIVRGDDPQVTLSMTLWLAGKFKDLWAEMPGELRAPVDKQIASAAAKALNGNVGSQRRFITLFGFHRSALDVQKQLVETYAADGDLVAAENLLLKMSRHPARAVAAAALERLARLLRDFNLNRDADYFYQQLERQFAETRLPDGKTVYTLVEQLRQNGVIGQPQTRCKKPTGSKKPTGCNPWDWGDGDLKVILAGRSYGSFTQQQEVKSPTFNLPFYRQYRFQIHQRQRLGMLNAADDSMYWSLPLRSGGTGAYQRVVARSTGHQMIVLYRGVLHSLSPAHRKVLWTRRLDPRGPTSNNGRIPNPAEIQPMQPGTGMLSFDSLSQQSAAGGMLAASNAEYVCIYGCHSFTVLDAITGEVRWTRQGLSRNAMLHGNDRVIYVVPPNGRGAVALRALDGKQLDASNLSGLLAKTLRISDRGLVLFESGSSLFGLFRPQAVIRLYDPLTDKEHWKLRFPAGTHFSLLEDGRLVALTPQSRLELVDLEAGHVSKMQNIANLDLKSKPELYVLADHDNVYLIVNSRDGGHFHTEGGHSLPVDGSVFAFDVSTGKQLWRQQVRQQSLLLQEFNHVPILVFAAQKSVKIENRGYTALRILALDKQTGHRRAERTLPMRSSVSVPNLSVNLGQRYVELRTNYERIRLIATDNQTAAAN